VPDRASDDYVRRTFDHFADAFDENLRDLGYRAPQLVAEALERHRGAAGDVVKLDVLDAGAGTGLCGPLLRDRAGTLVGVDLSSGMLEKARASHLRRTGRLGTVRVHAYVEAALVATGLESGEISPAILRSELGTDVHGFVVVARQPGGGVTPAESAEALP
jgi:predicted TPR repeat methyltransferase